MKYYFRFGFRPFGVYQTLRIFKDWEFDTEKDRNTFASIFPHSWPFDYGYYIGE